MGYSALRAGVGFIPFAIAMGIGLGASSQLVSWFPPRVVVITGGILVVGAMIYGSTLDRRHARTSRTWSCRSPSAASVSA